MVGGHERSDAGWSQPAIKPLLAGPMCPIRPSWLELSYLRREPPCAGSAEPITVPVNQNGLAEAANLSRN